MNSDATTIFLDTIPRLRSGVLVEIHDVTLPYDYPTEWIDRYYSEQYLLAAYILANRVSPPTGGTVLRCRTLPIGGSRTRFAAYVQCGADAAARPSSTLGLLGLDVRDSHIPRRKRFEMVDVVMFVRAI